MKNLNVIFMGTPDFSVPVLNMLIKNTNVIGVLDGDINMFIEAYLKEVV